MDCLLHHLDGLGIDPSVSSSCAGFLHADIDDISTLAMSVSSMEEQDIMVQKFPRKNFS